MIFKSPLCPILTVEILSDHIFRTSFEGRQNWGVCGGGGGSCTQNWIQQMQLHAVVDTLPLTSVQAPTLMSGSPTTVPSSHQLGDPRGGGGTKERGRIGLTHPPAAPTGWELPTPSLLSWQLPHPSATQARFWA